MNQIKIISKMKLFWCFQQKKLERYKS